MRENTPYSDLFQTIGIKIKRKADDQVNELGLNAQQGRVIGYIYEHQDEGLIQKTWLMSSTAEMRRLQAC